MNKEVIEYYRFTKEDLVGTKRLLFTQGGYDPTTSFGPQHFPLLEDPDPTRAVLIYSNAHREEDLAEEIDESESVKR